MSCLEERLKARARELGFELVGVAPAVTPPGAESLRQWLAKGYEGEMGYLSRHAAAREHPRAVLPEVRSVVMVGMNYKHPLTPNPSPTGGGGEQAGAASYVSSPPSPLCGRGAGGEGVGRISNYAWGDDYHDLLRQRLHELLDWIQEEAPGCKGRAVVDTAPLLERDFARLAGLGWFGKNTMLLNKRFGSYFFIGALLLDLELRADRPFETNHCGTCTACLEACPTQAFTGPGELDARRCISYLTIELRGPIPRELRAPMGNWIFGCDICQEVCPWNRKAPLSNEPAFGPHEGSATADLIELLRLSPEAFRQRFRGTTIPRAKRSGLLRNVAIALGNSTDLRVVPALIEALQDAEPLVRGAAAWALGRFDVEEARVALVTRREMETDPTVRAELEHALGRCCIV